MHKEVIIFGIGKYGKQYVKRCVDCKVSHIRITDSNKELWGTEYMGISVERPEDVFTDRVELVVVAVSDKYRKEIFNKLAEQYKVPSRNMKYYAETIVLSKEEIYNMGNMSLDKELEEGMVLTGEDFMKLSVIIPVYNTEEYLQQSIESVIRQTYKNIEVILVNDGSTDGSGEICDRYAEAYGNIKVIHQKNEGNVSARCHGAEEAAGEYVTFMDSDDWIAEDMYETLMEAAEAESCDIVSQSGYMVYDGGECRRVEGSTMSGAYGTGKDYDEFLSRMMYDGDKNCVGIGPSLSHKVIKKKIMDEIAKKVDKNIVLGGDAAIFYSSCLRAKSICIIEGYGYFYRVRKKSVSHSYDASYFHKIYTLYKYFEKLFLDYDRRYCLMEQLRKHLWHFLRMQMEQIFGMEFKSTYLFPYQSVAKGSKIILYGAGMVGHSYYEQIRKNGYCDIAAWVDSNAYKQDKNVLAPMEIVGMEYSQIIIAVKDKKNAEEIIQSLIDLGVNKGKMVWVEPCMMDLL